MTLVRVYCGLASADGVAAAPGTQVWLTVAVVDDSGRLLDICEVSDDAGGYAELCALLAQRGDGPGSVAVATHTDEHVITQLLNAAGRYLAYTDEDSADDYAERFADDDSPDEVRSGPAERRAVGLARALQAGVLSAVPQAAPRDLIMLKPLLAAHAAMVTGRQHAAGTLREVLRELYPAALRAFADPAEQVPLAILDALPEPGQLGVGPTGRTREGQVVATLAEAGIADRTVLAESVTALRVAVAETPRRSGVTRPMTSAVAETVRQAVVAVRASDIGAQALVDVINERMARPGINRVPGLPPALPEPLASPLRVISGEDRPMGRRARAVEPEPAVAHAVAPAAVQEPIEALPTRPTQPARGTQPVAPPQPAAPVQPAAASLTPVAPLPAAPALPSRTTIPHSTRQSRPTQANPGIPEHLSEPAARGSSTIAAVTYPAVGHLPPGGQLPPVNAPQAVGRRSAERFDTAAANGTPTPYEPRGFGTGGSAPGGSAQGGSAPGGSAQGGSAQGGFGTGGFSPGGSFATGSFATGGFSTVTTEPGADALGGGAPAPRLSPEVGAPGNRSNWPLAQDPTALVGPQAAGPDPTPPPNGAADLPRLADLPRAVELPRQREGRVTPPWQADDLPAEPPTLRLVEPAPLADPALATGLSALDEISGELRFDPPALRLVEHVSGELPVREAPQFADLPPAREPLPNRHARRAQETLVPPVAVGEDDSDLLIFAECRSAWFTDPSAGADDVEWATAADQGWQAAELAARPAVGAETGAGLPRRVPQQNLVPGSPIPEPERPLRIVRDAASIAAHTSGYFRGYRRGQEVGGFSVGGRPGRESNEGWDFSREVTTSADFDPSDEFEYRSAQR